jgi:DNA-binding NarL/FixJ family response regulator
MNGFLPHAVVDGVTGADVLATRWGECSSLPTPIPGQSRSNDLFTDRGTVNLLTTNRVLGELLARHLGAMYRPDFIDQTWIEHSLPPDVVLIDSSYDPDDATVARAVRRCRVQRLSVVAFGCSRQPLSAARWVDLGVDALIYSESNLTELVQVVGQVARGENVLGVGVRETLLSELRHERAIQRDRESQFEGLTRREMEVLRLLARASTPEEISRQSFVSLNTVRTQIRSILAKLSASSVVGAVALAYSSGWMDVDKAGKAEWTTGSSKV